MADGKLVPLPPDQSSAEFKRAYDACLRTRRQLAKPAEPSPADPVPAAPTVPREPATVAPEKSEAAPAARVNVEFLPGTIGRAILTFKRSPRYLNDIRPSSRATYEHALVTMRDTIGIAQLSDFADVDTIDAYSEEVAVSRWVTKEVRGTMKRVKVGGASTARLHNTLLSMIWGVCRKHAEFNIKGRPSPFRDAERRYTRAKNPALPWSEDEQDKFTATAPQHLALAYLMLKYFGQRGGDAIAVKWADFRQDAEGAWGIMVAPEKGDDRELQFLELPRVLVEALLRAREARGTAGTILVNRWGKPWAHSQTLSQAIRLHLIKIGLAARGTRTVSMHGLRKNAAILAADTDLGTDGIKTLTLHKSDQVAQYYAKKRSLAKLRKKVIARINEMEDDKREAAVAAKRATISVVR
jgi:integrase